MKKSKYNIIFKTEDGKVLAFNSTSCALAEVENEFIEILENIENIENVNECESKTRELIEQMKKGNYIIEDCVDELLQLKFRNNRGKYASNSLGLTIAPTLLCNFKCPYCYETPKEYMMNNQVQQAIVELVEKNIKYIGDFSVTWYGGEPLVGQDVIYSLSSKFMEICNNNNVTYSAFIVTNGYLLNEDTINKMFDAGIKSCQITVDGPPRIHNQRRILKNGGETFETIMENIELFRKMGGNVSIRVNIDKTNITYVEELLEIFKEKLLQDIHINFGQITAYTEACNSIAGNCLTTEEYSKVNINLQKLLHKYGFTADDYPYYPGIKGNYCCADQLNSFVIDPDGFMYKCWNSIGNLEETVGNVLNIENPSVEHAMRNVEWVSTNPFEDSCLECNLLPICMGGCPYLKKENKKSTCEKWKFNFEEMLKYTYEYKEIS